MGHFYTKPSAYVTDGQTGRLDNGYNKVTS